MVATSTEIFTPLKNPYTFGVPVRGNAFYGREEEQRIILSTLNNVPRGQKQDMAVMGPRRIGKSSLLYRLLDILTDSDDFLPVFVDLQNIKPRKPRFLFLKILRTIQKGFEQKGLTEYLPQFQMFGDTIAEDMLFLTFDDDLQELNDSITTHNLPRLVLLMDEIELLQAFGDLHILAWFRSIIQRKSYSIFIVAGSDELYAMTQDYGSPLFNIFKTVVLRPLEYAFARKLLEEPAQSIGMTIYPTEVEKILNASGNVPYFVQGIAHYLVEYLNTQNRSQVYAEDVECVLQTSLDHLSAQFNYIWMGLSKVKRFLLYVLAKEQQAQRIDTLMAQYPQFREYFPTARNSRETFDDLVRQQALLQQPDHTYRFVVPLFANWMISKVDDDEVLMFVSSKGTDQIQPSETGISPINQENGTNSIFAPKIVRLQNHIYNLNEELDALYKQLSYELDATSRLRLKRQTESLELELEATLQELADKTKVPQIDGLALKN